MAWIPPASGVGGDSFSKEVREVCEGEPEQMLAYASLLEALARDIRDRVERSREQGERPELLGRLRQHESASIERLIEKGTLLQTQDFCDELGISASALSRGVSAQRFFFIRQGKNRYFPRFYCEGVVDRGVVEKVAKALGALPGAVKYNFFRSKRVSLKGKSPLEALAAGEVDRVLEVAVDFVNS